MVNTTIVADPGLGMINAGSNGGGGDTVDCSGGGVLLDPNVVLLLFETNNLC